MKYFDLHCDTATECYQKGLGLSSNGLSVSLEQTGKYDRWAQVFAVWISGKLRGEAAFHYFQAVAADFKQKLLTDTGGPVLCRNGNDLKQADAAGKNMALLSIEGGAALGGELSHLGDVWKAGVRLMTLTWNGPNELGNGCMTPGADGLSRFGKEVVREMGELGMVVDVSHLSEKGFWDVAHTLQGPFVATHSDSKAIENHPRNLTDDQFREIVRRGGLVGLNLFAPFAGSGGTIPSLLKHAEHFLHLGGEKTVAIGADFDGCTLSAEIRGIGDMGLLYNAMCGRFGKEIADDIFYNNAFRFFTKHLN
ncbi:MAG: membrane dipeptidase [Oscillospiraceae bacterium]|jgi:membrane dipeptidase|nr:membrane dipeptidase [Oscillospiraceae bacterium]